jgi:hypothetical protein
MKDKYEVGSMEIGAEPSEDGWRIYVQAPKEKLKLHLNQNEEMTKAIAAVLAGMIRDEVSRTLEEYK